MKIEIKLTAVSDNDRQAMFDEMSFEALKSLIKNNPDGFLRHIEMLQNAMKLQTSDSKTEFDNSFNMISSAVIL